MVNIKVFAAALLAVFLASCMTPPEALTRSARFEMPESDIKVLEERLDAAGVYPHNLECTEGVCVLKFSGKHDPEFVERVMQDEFEAGIDGDFRFGSPDIEVCKKVECNSLRECEFNADNNNAKKEYRCQYMVAATINKETAERLAKATGEMESEEGFLSKNMSFYINGEKIGSVRMQEDLKGIEITYISISGWAYARTKEEGRLEGRRAILAIHAALSTDSPPRIENILWQ